VRSALLRDASRASRYRFPVKKLLLPGLLCLPLAIYGTEAIELQDGTKIAGRILSVTPESVVMDVQTSPTIREQKSYPRSDVAKIRRASQDDIAFEEVAAIVIPPTADDPAVYDALLGEKVRPFMKNYPYSKHMPEARKLAAALEAERDRVAAGETKVDGEWMAADASPADRAELGGRVQLAKMKAAEDPVAGLMAFEVLEKNGSTSSSYPESVTVALELVEKLRPNIARAKADLERRTSEQEQGLELAGEDSRLLMEQGIAQEKAAIQARLDRAKQSGSKWMPVLPDAQTLDALSRLADAEQARLSRIDVATLSAGVAAAKDVRTKLEAGDLGGAKASLDEAQKLWSQHVLLASLKESLKKAESEAAQSAAVVGSKPKQP
jgi:hypothetical protein